MLNSYLTTALRHLWRERGYAAINLFGLAIGLALCLLVIQLAAYQLSVGDFHEKKDRVFRVLRTDTQDPGFTSGMHVPLGPTLEEQLPEVEAAVRFGWSYPRLLRVGDKEGIYETVGGAEAGVFDMFSLPLLRGDPGTALSRPFTIVLTEPLARRLFGESDPMGQVVNVGESDYEITGIAGRVPSSSLLQFSALISFATQYEVNPMMESGWSASGFRTFVQLSPGADAEAAAARIPGIVKEASGWPEVTDSYVLQPLKSIYFDTEASSTIGPSGNPMYLALSAILAVVILTIAGVNYVNLATARAGRRIHEIGVRKALGAHRGQLIRQLLSESVLMSSAATILGAVLAAVMLQLIPAIAGSAFDFPSLHWSVSTYAGAAVLATGVGVVAGAYPAWVVARMQPTAHLGRGRLGGARLRRGLVVTQFTATTALLTMTLLMWHQLAYVDTLLRENSILGMEPEEVVVVRNRGLSVDQARAFKTELLQDSRIASVSLAMTVPGEGSRASQFSEGRTIWTYQVDADFVEIMGLRMLQGRALTDAPADAEAVVINETAVRVLGLEDPLGKTMPTWGDKRIVGVVEDFHFDGPRSEVEPLMLEQLYGWAGVIIVRVQSGHLEEALGVIDDKWAAVAPHRPIKRHSLEEITANLYSEELMVGRALTAFLLLAIAVAAVGLFGMAAHAAHERTREIGVRKVFGASAGGLTAMMLRDFARPVAIAFVLSVPVAWWLGNQWLHDFAYRVEMGIRLFVVSGALSFLVAGLTVGHQAMRAALTNPVDTLRTE